MTERGLLDIPSSGQDRQNKTGRTAQAELDRQNRTGRTGQAGQDSQNSTDNTGQEERDRQNETVQDRQGRQDYQDQDWTAMTGNKKRTARTGRPEKDSHDS